MKMQERAEADFLLFKSLGSRQTEGDRAGNDVGSCRWHCLPLWGGALPGNPSPQATDASPPSTCRWKVGKRHAGGEPAVPHATRRAHRLRCEALAETAPPSRIPEDEHQGERMRMRLLRTPADARTRGGGHRGGPLAEGGAAPSWSRAS